MIVDDKMLNYTAALAKLNINQEEREALAKSMSEIIGYMETMNELDTSDAVPMSHVFPVENVFREDTVVESYERDELLKNAPEKKEGSFKVPKTVI